MGSKTLIEGVWLAKCFAHGKVDFADRRGREIDSHRVRTPLGMRSVPLDCWFPTYRFQSFIRAGLQGPKPTAVPDPGLLAYVRRIEPGRVHPWDPPTA